MRGGMRRGSSRPAARSKEGLTERALQGEDTTKTKNQLKQPLTLNTLSTLTPTRCTSLSLYSRGASNALFRRCCKKVSAGDDFLEPC